MTTFLTIALFAIWPFSDNEIQQEIERIHNEAKSHFKINSDSAISLVNLALIKSEKANYTYGTAKSLYMLGSAANKQGKPALATSYFLDALNVYNSLDDPESFSIRANICLTMGKIFWHHSRSQESIEFYEKGVDLALKANDNKLLVKLLHNTAVAYHTGRDYGTATKYLMKELNYIDSDNKNEKIRAYNELGAVFYNQRMYVKAKEWFNKILVIETSRGASRFRGQALHNLANICKDEGHYAKALDLFEKALLEKELLGNPQSLFITYQDMAELALLEGRSEQALVYANKATPLLGQVPNVPEYFDQYDILSRCVEEKDAVLALKYNRMYSEKYKSFDQMQKDLIAQIEGYQLDLVLANYDKKIMKRAQRHRTLWMLSCGLFFFLAASYFSYRVWRVYSYQSPQTSLELIKNPNEMSYLLDVFRNEKEEYKKTIRQTWRR